MKKDVYLGNGCFGSGKELKHFKYISRKKVGGKWVYEYADATPTTKKPKSTASDFKPDTKHQELERLIRYNKEDRAYFRAKSKAQDEETKKLINEMEVNAGPGDRNLGERDSALRSGTRWHEDKKRPDGAALQRERAEKHTAAKKAKVDNLKSASKMQTTGVTKADQSTAKVNEKARNDNRQTPDRASEQVKLAEKRTAAKKAKVANIKSASKMQVTGMTDIDKSRAKVDERAANDNRQKVNSPVEKKKLEENNKQQRLLKNLKKAIANSRKKKKVQKK